jgi:hypothetical protein
MMVHSMTAPKPQRRWQGERSSEIQEMIILAAIDVLRTRGFGLRGHPTYSANRSGPNTS